MQWVRRLSDGVARLSQKDFGSVLLDLSLIGNDGIETFKELFDAAAKIPVLVVGKDDQKALAAQALEHGAKDFILSSHLDDYSLPRALRSAEEQSAAENARNTQSQLALATLNAMVEGVLCADSAGKVAFLNPVAETMTGWSSAVATGEPLEKVFHIVDGPKTDAEPAPEQSNTESVKAARLLVSRDGTETPVDHTIFPVRDQAGQVIGSTVTFRVAKATADASAAILQTAQYDVVTNLPGRVLFNDRTAQAIALARREKNSMAVMYLYLNNFKYINDRFGSSVGDNVLRAVAKHLSVKLRGTDTICRNGGSEFIILLAQVSRPGDPIISAERLLRSLDALVPSPETPELRLRASIGISIFPNDGDNSDTLIRKAETAMLQGKVNGHNTFRFFTEQ